MTGSLPHTLGYFAHMAALAAGLFVIERTTRDRRPSRLTSSILAVACVTMAVASFLASDPPDLFEDFRIAYYPAGHAALSDPSALHDLMSEGVSGFVNLPATAYLFAPFAALPWTPAVALFTVAGLASLAVAWKLLADLAALDRTARWQLALLFAASGPLQYSLREGNTSHMVLPALAGGLILLRAKRAAAAGLLLGLAAVIKPPLALMGLVFVLRREPRGLLAFAGLGIAAVMASVALFGWTENQHWFETSILAFNHQWLAAFNVQSIPAFLARLESPPGRLMDWNGYEPSTASSITARLLTGALFAGAAAALLRRSNETARHAERLDLTYLLLVCLSVLASPLSWSHYYAWLMIPAAFLLRRDAEGRAPMRWAAILLLSPLVWPLNPSADLPAVIYRMAWASHLLFGGLLTLGLVGWRLASTGGLATRRPYAGALAPSGAK